MSDSHLYQQIAETIRREIIDGQLKPGDNLPSIRQMTQQWHCTPGTIHRAYRELALQKLVISHVGKGTSVSGSMSPQADLNLRRATLIHRAESFLLEVLSLGYTAHEVDQAVQIALDRWKSVQSLPSPTITNTLRFYGSHDPALNWVIKNFCMQYPEYSIPVTFTGSLMGLTALSENQADIAGSHLWDRESDSYNAPYIRKLMPGRTMSLLTLAHRRIGLMVPGGNPQRIHSLKDLLKEGVVFANRQAGSGTRVWLEAILEELRIDKSRINGFNGKEYINHTEIAQAICEGLATTGLGLEMTSKAYGLEFIFLAEQRYDLVIPTDYLDTPIVRDLAGFIRSEVTKKAIADLGGYDISETGQLGWISL